MNSHETVSPVLKWAGGKRQLLDTLTGLIPERFETYCEPFVGGGAMLFRLRPPQACVNDVNPELMGVYSVIKTDVEALIDALGTFVNDAGEYYRIRNLDRDPKQYAAMSDVMKAARVIYLNKTCYNGLYRVNGAGEFNTPFGGRRSPDIVNAAGLRAVSGYFNTASVRLTCGDYALPLRALPKGAFVYLDPPYDPLSRTAGFTGYAKGGFSAAEQIRLRECCDELNRKGVRFMLSNSSTDFIREQYAAYRITAVRARRAINSAAAGRGEVEEVVVRNYG